MLLIVVICSGKELVRHGNYLGGALKRFINILIMLTVELATLTSSHTSNLDMASYHFFFLPPKDAPPEITL